MTACICAHFLSRFIDICKTPLSFSASDRWKIPFSRKKFTKKFHVFTDTASYCRMIRLYVRVINSKKIFCSAGWRHELTTNGRRRSQRCDVTGPREGMSSTEEFHEFSEHFPSYSFVRIVHQSDAILYAHNLFLSKYGLEVSPF